MRRAIAILGLIGALTAPAFAEGPADQQILGLSLGQRAADPNDMGGLQAAFGPLIAKQLKGLILDEGPNPHYLLDLGNDRMLGIWFDGESKDRPIYWLDLTEQKGRSSATPRDRPDFQITSREGVPLRRIDITIDPALPAARKAEIKSAISGYLDQHPPDKLPTNDAHFRLELLGDHFRGRLTSTYAAEEGKQRIETELFDATLAHSVLSRTTQ